MIYGGNVDRGLLSLPPKWYGACTLVQLTMSFTLTFDSPLSKANPRAERPIFNPLMSYEVYSGGQK